MVMPGEHTPLDVNLDKPIAVEAGRRGAGSPSARVARRPAPVS
jgi:translation elongation factor EF-Tu-like GTPase